MASIAQPSGEQPSLTGASNLFRPPAASSGQAMDVATMEDDQLYSMIMGMDPPPPVSVPTGAEERPLPVSLEEAKKAIQSAKASVGAKSTSKSDQTDGGSNSEDDDFSPKGARSGKNKRVMANRQSAQRSRLRKLQYIQDLENNVSRLQNEIRQIQPQLTFLREKYSGLSVQNEKLRSRVAALLNEARYKDQVNGSLKEEIAQMVAKNQTGEGHNSFGGQQPTPLPFSTAMQ